MLARPNRIPSLKHGIRGWVTCSTAEPTWNRSPIETGSQLAAVVERAAPATPRGRRRIHPATRVFQALRIAVNRELETLPAARDVEVISEEAGVRWVTGGGSEILTEVGLTDQNVARRITGWVAALGSSVEAHVTDRVD